MTTPRLQLTLREWAPTELSLTAGQAALLADSPASLTVAASRTAGVYTITPSSKVGAVSTPHLDLVITPKMSVDRFFRLLSYSKEFPLEIPPARLRETSDVTKPFCEAFLNLTANAFRKGILRGYRSHDEAIIGVRGRIRLADQFRRRQGLPLPLEVTYDDYVEDVLENQLIKAALRRVQRLCRGDTHLLRTSAEMLSVLEMVSDVRFDVRQLPCPAITRLNQHYSLPLSMARLIVANSSVELDAGGSGFSSFFIDMNVLFEEFLYRALGERLTGAGAWRHGAQVFLDQASRVEMKPDLSIWLDHTCLFLGDAKYKETAGGGTNDLYQMLAYCQALGLSQGTLFYATAAGAQANHVVRRAGTVLKIRSVDLGSPWADLMARLDVLAEGVAESIESAQPIAA